MRRLLHLTLAVEVLVALWWTILMVPETGSSGIAVLGWFSMVVAIYLAAFLIGAVVAWRRPALRRQAGLVMVMPLAGGFAPMVIRIFTGGPLAVEGTGTGILLPLLAVIGLGLAFPRRMVRWMPQALFRSRGWNLFLLAALGLAWCALIVAVLWGLSPGGQDAMDAANRTGSPGIATAWILLLASTHLLLLGLGSALTGVWGWLGIRGGVEGAQRRIHMAQLLGAAPGILVAIATWVWLAGQTTT